MRCCPHVKAEEFLDYDDEIAAEELEAKKEEEAADKEKKEKENKSNNEKEEEKDTREAKEEESKEKEEKTSDDERLIDQMDPERAEVKSHLIELNQDECSYCGKEISTEVRIEKEINKIKSSFCSEECLKEFLDAIDYVDDYK